MLNVKVKTVVKTICFVSLFVVLCYVEGKYNFIFKDAKTAEKLAVKIFSSEYQVYGTVQGVFFRKHAVEEANKLGVRGWCMNTKEWTVKGMIEGEEKAFNAMKHWLSKVGSPNSKVSSATFTDAKVLTAYSFPGFEIREAPAAPTPAAPKPAAPTPAPAAPKV